MFVQDLYLSSNCITKLLVAPEVKCYQITNHSDHYNFHSGKKEDSMTEMAPAGSC